MTRGFVDRRAVRAVNSLHFAQELSGRFVNHHHAILPPDEEAMVRRVGDDVIPAAVSAHDKVMTDPVLRA